MIRVHIIISDKEEEKTYQKLRTHGNRWALYIPANSLSQHDLLLPEQTADFVCWWSGKWSHPSVERGHSQRRSVADYDARCWNWRQAGAAWNGCCSQRWCWITGSFGYWQRAWAPPHGRCPLLEPGQESPHNATGLPPLKHGKAFSHWGRAAEIRSPAHPKWAGKTKNY